MVIEEGKFTILGDYGIIIMPNGGFGIGAGSCSGGNRRTVVELEVGCAVVEKLMEIVYVIRCS